MGLEKDIFYALRVAYIALLQGQIKLGTETIPIRNNAGSGNKYVLVQGFSGSGISNKTITKTLTAVQFSIFCKGDNLVGNEADDIAGQIIEKVLPYPSFKILSNEYFDVTDAREVTNIPIYGSEGNTSTKILERNIVIEHSVTHLKRSK